jgi:hypothetical protein
MPEQPNTKVYEVGYGKPPKATRFRKGQSGNPKGRPRNEPPDLFAILNQLLGQSIVVREGDRTRRISRAQALLLGLVNEGLKQKPGAVKLLLKLVLQGRPTSGPPPSSGVLATPAEVDMDEWLAQYGLTPPKEEP